MLKFFLKFFCSGKQKVKDAPCGEFLPASDAKEVGRYIFFSGLIDFNGPHIVHRTYKFW